MIKDIIRMCYSKDRVFDLSGDLTIGEFIELLRKSLLFISNDSGPTHIAISLGIDIAVFMDQPVHKDIGP